jgi:hypothetical protein|nr:MAG TPA_asm: hypothetical protein [Caudoviricetes sp.]
MNAEEMFKQLGYEFEREYTSDGVNDTYRYNKCSGPTDSVIFYLNGKQIIINQTFHTIHLNELQAIIQQCKELGWFESESKQETNYEHFKDEIIENCMFNLAIVKGKPKLCNSVVYCSDCEFYVCKDNENNCNEKFKEWLKKPHEKPTFKLTQFEYDLLQHFSVDFKFKEMGLLKEMKEKGHFKNINGDELIKDILESCEVIK